MNIELTDDEKDACADLALLCHEILHEGMTTARRGRMRVAVRRLERLTGNAPEGGQEAAGGPPRGSREPGW